LLLVLERKYEVDLKNLRDQDLLTQTKQLVQQERKVLTEVLCHLKEVERRRLYSDLGYPSLFRYAVAELKYSEGQAGRRINAIRLIKEIPEIEAKIRSGKLSLTNVSQAQSFFREQRHDTEQKREVLAKLENKSAREGQRELLKLQPEAPLPKERERRVSETHSELRFCVSNELREKIEKFRSLLGPKGAQMGMADLIGEMAGISLETLETKRFGKKRVKSTPAPELRRSKNARQLSKSLRYQVWQKDESKCSLCHSQSNLQVDHIQPVAYGGPATLSNLRLLCFSCNQRQAMKVFGVSRMRGFGLNERLPKGWKFSTLPSA